MNILLFIEEVLKYFNENQHFGCMEAYIHTLVINELDGVCMAFVIHSVNSEVEFSLYLGLGGCNDKHLPELNIFNHRKLSKDTFKVFVTMAMLAYEPIFTKLSEAQMLKACFGKTQFQDFADSF